MARTALRICPFCEATCGLALTVDDATRQILTVRGDADDVFSNGYLCPKGVGFGDLDRDVDRLQAPLVRSGDTWRTTTWDEAFAIVEDRLTGVLADSAGSSGGRSAVGVYLGNPSAHTVAGGLYSPVLLKALGTSNVFSASTLDQMPKQVAIGYLYGSAGAFTVPDLDRTDHLVIFGANPMVSNGSLATAADFPGKLRALRRRGGRLTVVDPARTRTARLADRHLAPRPGTDAALLLGTVAVLIGEDLVTDDLGGLAAHVAGLDEIRAMAADVDVDDAAAYCGVDADEIRAVAREIASAPSAAVYGRIGTTTVEFGTLASWLIDVINVLTGNLDRPGGVMFPVGPTARPPRPGLGRGFRTGRWHSRVSGHPEVAGELPAVALAEEIDTPGDGRIRAMITVAGNPVLSAPDGPRLSAAFDTLDVMVCVDPYLNETTRHADVILPPPPSSHGPHFDFALNNLAVHATARYTPPVWEPDGPSESEILARLALIATGAGAQADPQIVDDQVIMGTLASAVADPASPVHGRDVTELVGLLVDGPGYERRLDAMLRLGPYGDGFGADPDGLSLTKLREHPHGIDLGPMQPQIPDVLRTPSEKIELAPPPLLADLDRLRAAMEQRASTRLPSTALRLIGRRQLRSNNSWMHNLPALVGGSNRCTLQIHPDDANRLGLGDDAVVEGAGGTVTVPVERTEDLRPGVVSIPHGWGHDLAGVRLGVAHDNAGANVNQLNDGRGLDPLSGTAVLNGIEVHVRPA